MLYTLLTSYCIDYISKSRLRLKLIYFSPKTQVKGNDKYMPIFFLKHEAAHDGRASECLVCAMCEVNNHIHLAYGFHTLNS